jgi:arylformamidase
VNDYRLLSHRLDEDQPNWPGAPGLRRIPSLRLAAGDLANTHVLEIYTHYGTHCDLPYHFLEDGVTLDRIDHRQFVFHRPYVLDLPLGDEQLITPDHLTGFAKEADADLLLLRSGFEAHRDDHDRYIHHGPGFSAAAATYLREAFPQVRAIALDWLSLCSLAHVDDGVDAHRMLLRADTKGQYVIIFEDVRMSTLEGARPVRVFALPLFIDGLDGSPVSILAEVEELAGVGELAGVEG